MIGLVEQLRITFDQSDLAAHHVEGVRRFEVPGLAAEDGDALRDLTEQPVCGSLFVCTEVSHLQCSQYYTSQCLL